LALQRTGTPAEAYTNRQSINHAYIDIAGEEIVASIGVSIAKIHRKVNIY
jgi:hypothetical protein